MSGPGHVGASRDEVLVAKAAIAATVIAHRHLLCLMPEFSHIGVRFEAAACFASASPGPVSGFRFGTFGLKFEFGLRQEPYGCSSGGITIFGGRNPAIGTLKT